MVLQDSLDGDGYVFRLSALYSLSGYSTLIVAVVYLGRHSTYHIGIFSLFYIT